MKHTIKLPITITVQVGDDEPVKIPVLEKKQYVPAAKKPALTRKPRVKYPETLTIDAREMFEKGMFINEMAESLREKHPQITQKKMQDMLYYIRARDYDRDDTVPNKVGAKRYTDEQDQTKV